MEYVVQQAIIYNHCSVLDLSANNISSEGASILAHVLKANPPLHELLLDHNHVSDRGTQMLAQAISTDNTNLRVLYLGSNNITNEGAKYLAEMLKTNRTLNRLYLFENTIGDHGVQLLAEALTRHNQSVTHIDFSGNRLENDATINALINMIKCNHSLKQLRVANCGLSQTSKTRLQEATKSKGSLELRI